MDGGKLRKGCTARQLGEMDTRAWSVRALCERRGMPKKGAEQETDFLKDCSSLSAPGKMQKVTVVVLPEGSWAPCRAS